MPRQCAICVSADRLAFEAAVASGTTVTVAARSMGLPQPAAFRHARSHGAAPALALVEPWAAVDTFRAAFGAEPMPHQVAYLSSTRHLLVRKGRQVGMTQAAAALAIHVARQRPGDLAAVISAS